MKIARDIVLLFSLLGVSAWACVEFDQAPCFEYAEGRYAYSLNRMNDDGTCREVCAGGSSLTWYRDQGGFECGECTRPSCPDQEPCAEYGSNTLAYLIFQVEEDGSCRETCTGGDTLARYLFNGEYTCGSCLEASCPDQEPCYEFSNGLLGYSIYKEEDDGSCRETCAAGDTLRMFRQDDEYMCGNCPEETPEETDETVPSVSTNATDPTNATDTPDDAFNATDPPDDAFNATDPPDDAFPTNETGLTNETDTTGEADLTDRTDATNATGRPSCPNQEPCQSYGDNWKAYFLYHVHEDGSCTDYCAGGASLTKLRNGTYDGFIYTCGVCPQLEQETETESEPEPEDELETELEPESEQELAQGDAICPEAPCLVRPYGNAWGDAWSAYNVTETADGKSTCIETCKIARDLKDLLEQGYKCGVCPF